MRLTRSGGTAQWTVFQLSTAFDAPPAALGSCSDTLTMTTAGCPPGTEERSNPQVRAVPWVSQAAQRTEVSALPHLPAIVTAAAVQAVGGLAVYRPKHCVPGSSGYQCTGGACTTCDGRTFSAVLGAAACQACSANGTGMGGGGGGRGEPPRQRSHHVHFSASNHLHCMPRACLLQMWRAPMGSAATPTQMRCWWP